MKARPHAAADVPRIFWHFYRVDKARSREVDGTDLGLTIVKDPTEEMQGAVSVESQTVQVYGDPARDVNDQTPSLWI